MTNHLLFALLGLDAAACVLLLCNFERLLFAGVHVLPLRRKESTLTSVIPEERFGRAKRYRGSEATANEELSKC